MRVRLLGTGAADGWPQAFCRCDSCAAQRVGGVLRVPTSALVDEVLLVDGNADSPGAATRAGSDLAGVRHLLVSHAHVDHLAPQLLLFRSWVSQEPIDVVGPASVIEACRPWVAPDAPVRWIETRVGEEIELGRYRVRVLPANHRVMADGDAVLYDVEGPDGARLLWGCDTGPWEPAWFETVRDADFEVVVLEQTFGDAGQVSDGHLHLDSFAELVDGLRGVGAVTAATEVLAVHLSHHNPPEPELVARLAATGARPGRDGELVTARPAGQRRPAYGRRMTARDDRPLVVAMGISGTGKSAVGRAVAERLGIPFADGDDFHRPSSIAKMAAGVPLTDEDRWPWLEDVAGWLADHQASGGVIACSALKRVYRDLLRRGADHVGFLHLVGDHDLIQERMEKRDHFMPPTLLASQESTLEPLQDDEQGWELDIRPSIEQIVDEFVERAGLHRVDRATG